MKYKQINMEDALILFNSFNDPQFVKIEKPDKTIKVFLYDFDKNKECFYFKSNNEDKVNKLIIEMRKIKYDKLKHR